MWGSSDPVTNASLAASASAATPVSAQMDQEEMVGIPLLSFVMVVATVNKLCNTIRARE